MCMQTQIIVSFPFLIKFFLTIFLGDTVAYAFNLFTAAQRKWRPACMQSVFTRQSLKHQYWI